MTILLFAHCPSGEIYPVSFSLSDIPTKQREFWVQNDICIIFSFDGFLDAQFFTTFVENFLAHLISLEFVLNMHLTFLRFEFFALFEIKLYQTLSETAHNLVKTFAILSVT